MSLDTALARVQYLQGLLDNSPPPAASTSTSPTAASGAFAQALQSAAGQPTATAASLGTLTLPSTLAGQAMGSAPGSVTGANLPSSVGALTPTTAISAQPSTPAAAMVQIARGEIGQAEQPDGSNDSPRIAQYRSAVAGDANAVGPWCSYFVSWVANQAGVPLGNQGQGFASVDQLYSWAQSAGRAVPNGQGYVPRPGDLIVFPEHVGVVESVLPNGQIQTIEGNYSNKVSENVRGANEATGYIRMS